MSDDLCGNWMPVSKAPCGLPAGHASNCRSADAVAVWRARSASAVRNTRPEDRALWRRKSKFIRFGITEDEFNQMLEEQRHACGICREPFGRKYVSIDHDHNCCKPKPSGESYSCGECVRGLLCIRCNTWLSWLEKYGGAIEAYLARRSG